MDENNQFEEFEKSKRRRKQMLPWWIKVFCWIFMLFGLLSIVCLFLGFTDVKPNLAFYGFETNEPFSFIGLIVISLGIFKGITAFALWFEKDFAIKIGKIDALIGIVLCAISMVVLPFVLDDYKITIRLELALLIPYFLKLTKIQNEWETTVE